MAEQTPSCALVVDDDTLIRMDAISILEDAGFEVLDAADVDKALGVLAIHHPRLHLLFTDVHMPGPHDGFHLAREVARCWPHVAIIVASGRATPGPGDMPDGAHFVSKPFSAEVVHEHLCATMPAHRQPKPPHGGRSSR